ncbi:hypothetical protein BVI434_980027 [Burkholderia vietnamiensis]|nr:hypothetical protein BVI434_980027 [Burkholderia vietnamiensis]
MSPFAKKKCHFTDRHRLGHGKLSQIHGLKCRAINSSPVPASRRRASTRPVAPNSAIVFSRP